MATRAEHEHKLASHFQALLWGAAPDIADQVARLYEAEVARKLAKAGEHQLAIAVDFDGVCMDDRAGHPTDPTDIDDEPVEGTLDALIAVLDADIRVFIFSARLGGSDASEMTAAMKAWFTEHGLGSEYLNELEFTAIKPPEAKLFIDNRAWLFSGPGTFPTPDQIQEFKSWNEK